MPGAIPILSPDQGTPLPELTLHPPPGSPEEFALYRDLQQQFAAEYEQVFPNKLAPKTVVIVPSLSMDQEILSKVDGISHYEERLLCLLMLLRMPRTHVVYVTSMPIDPVVVDYYLHLLPGITAYHARQRLTLLSCYDHSPRPLTLKILERPRVLERIRASIPEGHAGHLSCFNVTVLERSLAVQLRLPVYGCDPELYSLGSKSSSRRILRECGLRVPPGFEDLRDAADLVEGLAEMKRQLPDLRQAVIKMNDGFSGEGNALFSFDGYRSEASGKAWIRDSLERSLCVVAAHLSTEQFLEKFRTMGGIVEAFVGGEGNRSPSVQCRINPLGRCEVISTHEQVLDSSCGQIYNGAYFPAAPAYAVELGEQGIRIAENLRDKGVLGRFGVDFVSVPERGGWTHYAIEINLRKGGTTHPYLMLQFLTDGSYDRQMGLYFMANQQPRYYYTTDNLHHKSYQGLLSHDLIDIAMCNGLMYDGSSQEGVVFHLIGALSQFGKMGVVCIGASPGSARRYYERTVEVLDRETSRGRG